MEDKIHEYEMWVKSGSPMPAPDYARTLAVTDLARKFGVSVFVETGTLVGSRVGSVLGVFKEIHSVELSQELYNRCVERFRGNQNVRLYNGDSGKLLPGILSGIHEKCLYFLDAHYSAGTTARGNRDSALEDEMATILPRLENYDDIILVDDTYDLQDSNGYLSKETIVSMVRSVRPEYNVIVEDFILRAFPKVP
jgi:hypothetical protein